MMEGHCYVVAVDLGLMTSLTDSRTQTPPAVTAGLTGFKDKMIG